MSPSDLEEILYEEPFKPFRETLASGDRYLVNNPKRAMITELSLVVGLNENPEARTKLISVPNIVISEHINPRRPTGPVKSLPFFQIDKPAVFYTI